MKSALERRTLCLVAFVLIALGAGPSSASAATTVTITAPSTARVNPNHVASQDTTIIVSGHTDVDGTQVELKAEQDGSACNGTNGNSVNPTESPAITTAGDYSKHFGFRPETAGTYHLCAYVYNSPPGPSPVATSPPADVQVHDRLSVGTGDSVYVAGRAATVTGVVQQPSESADWHFEYGLTTSYGSVTPTHTAPPQPNGSGSGFVSADLLSLEPATTYHYRLVATDGGGTVAGQDRMFTTDPASSMTLTVPSTRFTDEDWPVTVSGSAGEASGLVLYVEPNGSSCAATNTDEAKRPGAELRSPYFGPGFGPGPGSVPAGQYSSSTSLVFQPLPTPGTYLVCTYLLANNRSQGPPEASASSLVTVSYRACPSLDFSVTGASEQTGDKAVFDAVLPADVGAEGTVVYIASSDGGRTVFNGDYRPAGENLITHGGPQQVSTRLNKKKSFLPSFDGPVTVTFTITYAVATPYEHCTLPDGTVEEGRQTSEISGSGYKYPTIRSAPQTITVTFRNHGTPPGGVITPGVATEIKNAVGDALTPTGSAAKIGAILKNGYKAPFVAKAAGQVTGAWYFVPKGAHVAGKPKPVLVASGHTTVKKPGKPSLKLRVSKKGKALLKKAKKIKLTAKGTFTPAGGKKLVVKRTIKLRR